MALRDQIMGMAAKDPSLARAVDAMEAQLADTSIMPEDLDQAIKILEFVVQNPDKYEEVRAAAIADGEIDESMFPPQYDQTYVVSLLLAFYGLQDRLSHTMAGGGLMRASSRLQTGGRGGDSELVHVNEREKAMLEQMGGAGTINPNTGLREYKSGFLKTIFKVLPIALSIIAPGIGTAIGGAIGLSGTTAAIAGGAVLGGASSALGGGNVLQGAALGGLGAGLGSAIGGAANKTLGLGLGERGASILGSGIVGAGVGAATGQGIGQGALQGLAGGAIGSIAGGGAGALSSAGRAFGQGITAGYDPGTAATMGATAGLANLGTNLLSGTKPSDTAISRISGQGTDPAGILASPKLELGPGTEGWGGVSGSTAPITDVSTRSALSLSKPTPTGDWQDPSRGNLSLGASATPAAGSAPASSKGLNLGMVAAGLSVLGALQGAPAEAQQAVSALSPTQQEYFNRPSITWDWDRMQKDAVAANQNLTQYMATNWNKVAGGAYNQPAMAKGGALTSMARYAEGAGSGRDDTISARLSDGEYVIDAETVAMLGDGSNKSGAQRLDEMRAEIRKQKGRALAKGKISPNAKSPLAYIREMA